MNLPSVAIKHYIDLLRQVKDDEQLSMTAHINPIPSSL